MLYRCMTPQHIHSLSDQSLVVAVKAAAKQECHATAHLIALVAEFDARRLYLGAGCSSLFVYCTQVLALSEHAAYGRIEAARLSRRFPLVLERLTAGELTLTAVGLLVPILTPDNHLELLDAARGKSRREVERIVASVRPQPPAATIIRKLPTRPAPDAPPHRGESVHRQDQRGPEPDTTLSAGDTPAPPAGTQAPDGDVPPRPAPASRRPVVAPLSTEQFRVQLTVSRETHDKLRRAQDLLRHTIPNGDPAAIVDRALTLLLEHLAKTKLGAASKPRPFGAGRSRTRHVPSAVRRAVWARDNGQCAFVGPEGRCRERGLLEFHHLVPCADGGTGMVDGLQLRCRAHNRHEAVLWDGGGGWVREASARYRT
ncbi:hypothetical protein BH23ACI1_BH23ACI1_07860 [soil metagenome]